MLSSRDNSPSLSKEQYLISKVVSRDSKRIFRVEDILGSKLKNFKSDQGKTERMIKGNSEQKSF